MSLSRSTVKNSRDTIVFKSVGKVFKAFLKDDPERNSGQENKRDSHETNASEQQYQTLKIERKW